MALAGYGLYLQGQPIQKIEKPIATGNYLSMTSFKVRKATKWDNRELPGADVKAEVVLTYSGPLGGSPVEFDVGDVKSPGSSLPIIVDDNGRDYRASGYTIFTSQIGSFRGQNARSCSYYYLLDISKLPAKGRILLKHRATADHSYPISISGVVRE